MFRAEKLLLQRRDRPQPKYIALAGGIFTASLDGCPGVWGLPLRKQQFVRLPKRGLSMLHLIVNAKEKEKIK